MPKKKALGGEGGVTPMQRIDAEVHQAYEAYKVSMISILHRHRTGPYVTDDLYSASETM